VSPRAADPSVATALVETAARILAEEGPATLTARRLAAAVGVSTTAVYTHFGGMNELRRAVRREGFVRLGRFLSHAKPHRDPVTELAELGWGYGTNAFANPYLYRAMFMEAPFDPADAAAGSETFERLVESVQRCMNAGRFPACSDAWSGAQQIWCMTHGVVSVALIGVLPSDDAQQLLTDMAATLFSGFGDNRSRTERSIAAATRRRQTGR
jgi:AcrR family transcriptional regulator